jgi:thiol-disulfide isomerase/thioredoxin
VAATVRVRAAVLAAAVGISLVGAAMWSSSRANDDVTPDAVLDEPGVYQEPSGATNPPLPIDQLPELTLSDADGSPVELRSDGRPMVVNLWFSTCAPCAKELAEFAEVDADVDERVRFIGVNPFDTPAAMTRFAADRGVTYELLRDPSESLGQALDVAAYPVTLFVAADGTILAETGAMSGDTLRQRIEVLFP